MLKVTEESISLDQVLTDLKSNNSGSVVTHVGVVRPASEERRCLYRIPDKREGGRKRA